MNLTLAWMRRRWQNVKAETRLAMYTLFYNHNLDLNYVLDIAMEPIFWTVDNCTTFLGPLLVVLVCVFTCVVVAICYFIGLPYYWNKDPYVTVGLLIVGHWLLLNNVFHYYMAFVTSPGYPPQDDIITEAVNICKKCISPKPPRAHHCSVCNRCVLKMDHHCPWLNNCIGFYNHRYFFMYMIYTIIGVLFIIVFGFEIAIDVIWNSNDFYVQPHLHDLELEGHPVRYNESGALIEEPEVGNMSEHMEMESLDDDFPDFMDVTDVPEPNYSSFEKRLVFFMVPFVIGVLIALGGLSYWHARLITRGETSIEANINASETIRLERVGRVYVNPYNFGRRKNWQMFLGLVRGRNVWRHVLIPSTHAPEGDGLHWHTINQSDEWP